MLQLKDIPPSHQVTPSDHHDWLFVAVGEMVGELFGLTTPSSDPQKQFDNILSHINPISIPNSIHPVPQRWKQDHTLTEEVADFDAFEVGESLAEDGHIPNIYIPNYDVPIDSDINSRPGTMESHLKGFLGLAGAGDFDITPKRGLGDTFSSRDMSSFGTSSHLNSRTFPQHINSSEIPKAKCGHDNCYTVCINNGTDAPEDSNDFFNHNNIQNASEQSRPCETIIFGGDGSYKRTKNNLVGSYERAKQQTSENGGVVLQSEWLSNLLMKTTKVQQQVQQQWKDMVGEGNGKKQEGSNETCLGGRELKDGDKNRNTANDNSKNIDGINDLDGVSNNNESSTRSHDGLNGSSRLNGTAGEKREGGSSEDGGLVKQDSHEEEVSGSTEKALELVKKSYFEGNNDNNNIHGLPQKDTDKQMGQEEINPPAPPDSQISSLSEQDLVSQFGASFFAASMQRLGLPFNTQAQIHRLQQITRGAGDIGEALENEKRTVKNELKNYDTSFFERFGVTPSRNEKEPIRPLYAYYRRVKVTKQRYQNVPAAQPKVEDPGDENKDLSVEERRLNRLQEQKAHIRQKLQAFQQKFFETNRRQIKYHKDITPIENEYKQYKQLKELIGRLTDSIHRSTIVRSARLGPKLTER